MSKIKKNIRLIVGVVLISIFIVFASNLIVIIRLKVTDKNVGQVNFMKKYFVESNDYDTKIDNFKKFMLKSNWMFIEIYDNKMIFRKQNLQKEINIDSLIQI